MSVQETTDFIEPTGSGALSRETAETLNAFVEKLRLLVDFCGRWASLLFVPLVLITVFDVCLRKTGAFQIDVIEFMGPLGRAFESTLLQEMEWHVHTALFAMVLGYGYINNTHVRVDVVREHLKFRRKAVLEFIGLTFFMIPFCCVVIYFAVVFAYDSFMISEISASQVGLPHRWIIKTLLAAGIIVGLLSGIAVWFQTIVILWGPSDYRFPLMTIDWPEEAGARFEGKERIDVDLTVSVDDDLNSQTKKILSREDQNG
jgi:TRAP-type mannitol/chloroaromatic compound transport system permease small subunit